MSRIRWTVLLVVPKRLKITYARDSEDPKISERGMKDRKLLIQDVWEDRNQDRETMLAA